MNRRNGKIGLGTLWRTVRHLRARQVVGRLHFRLRHPTPDLRPAPPLRPSCGVWIKPAMRAPGLVGDSRFRLLNVVRDLDSCGWDNPNVDRLWRYNLHYFDDLNASGSSARERAHRALIERWIRDNLPGLGTGWEPYPVSLRIVNWIKWFLSGSMLETVWLESLAVQARWLERRLEVHLLGNHLLANAKALVFAGLFFAGAEAQRWLQQGLEIVSRELREQVLEDGGQFERTPMYHALALEDLLDLLNLIGTQSPPQSAARDLGPRLREVAGRMLYWLRCMTHGDGSMGQFNDTAQGIAPSIQELERYAKLLGIRAPMPRPDSVTHLAASGYIRASKGSAILLLDVAPIGPDYLPGHAHADTLSFELSVGSRRVIVNGGTSCYGVGPQRLYERSTAAHSTVEVAGSNSSEVWSSFRVGRRARPAPVIIEDGKVSCSHDGYRYLPGSPVHHRCWHMARSELTVQDRVVPGRQPAVARYLLAPGLRLHAVGAGQWDLRAQETLVATVQVLAGEASVTNASHAPQFGVIEKVECLAVALVDGLAITRWTWLEDAHSLSD